MRAYVPSQRWLFTHTIFTTLSLIIIGISAALIVFASSQIWKNKVQETDLNNLKSKVHQLNRGIDGQTADIIAQIRDLDYITDGTEICLDGLCNRYPANKDMLNLLGCWNANTNFPLIQNGTGNNTDAYVVCEPGHTNIDGHGNWSVGDLIIYVASQHQWLQNIGMFNESSTNISIAEETIDMVYNCDVFLNDYATGEITFFNYSNGYYGVRIGPVINLTKQVSGFQCVIVSNTTIPSMYFPAHAVFYYHVAMIVDEPASLIDAGSIILFENGTIIIYADIQMGQFHSVGELPSYTGTWGTQFIYKTY